MSDSHTTKLAKIAFDQDLAHWLDSLAGWQVECVVPMVIGEAARRKGCDVGEVLRYCLGKWEQRDDDQSYQDYLALISELQPPIGNDSGS